jgi:2-dehydro-3-deoxyphosphogalactonate aldolase
MKLKKYLEEFPFIGIMRGIRPEEAVACASVLIDKGFRIIETPLNSPDPFRSIHLMAESYGETALIGAGTVTEVEQVSQVQKAGGKLIFSPNCDPKVIKATKECGLISIPGVATPTEAFAAIKAGADALKLFPTEIITPAAVKAIRATLPSETLLIPVGGINPSNWLPYLHAGAAGFGLGSSLYKEKMVLDKLEDTAEKFRQKWLEYINNQ